MELNRSQLSLLITLFSMAIVVLSLYNIRLGAKEAKEYVIEMALDPELFEEPEPEPEEQQELQPSERIKSHLAYNQTMKPSVGNPEPLKTLEELMAEQETEAEGENGEATEDGFANSLAEMRKKRQQAQEKYGEKTAETLERMNTVNKNTSISYSLVDRYHTRLPVPIYTCQVGGKVVVNITVDATGRVIDASINEKSSTSLNGCLTENALAYAYKSSFQSSSKASQIGTITYLFQGK